MKVRLAALAGAIAVLAIAPHASADVFSVTYQGVVTGGSDVEDLFGGLVTTGDAVTASYVYDTSLGVSSSTIYTDGDMVPFPGPDVELDGGFGFGVSSPILSATFTMDGFSYSYSPDYSADVSTGYGVFDYTDQGNDVFGSAETADALSGDDSEVVFVTDDAPSTNLLAKYSSTGFGLGLLNTAFVGPMQTSDSFTFQFGSVSAAPEPSTWALMIAGLGVAGFALRRRGALKPAAVQTFES